VKKKTGRFFFLRQNKMQEYADEDELDCSMILFPFRSIQAWNRMLQIKFFMHYLHCGWRITCTKERLFPTISMRKWKRILVDKTPNIETAQRIIRLECLGILVYYFPDAVAYAILQCTESDLCECIDTDCTSFLVRIFSSPQALLPCPNLSLEERIFEYARFEKYLTHAICHDDFFFEIMK
jgi:hypothetical protein